MSSRQKGTGKRSIQTSNGHEDKKFKNGVQNGHFQKPTVEFKFSEILQNQENNLSSSWKTGEISEKLTDIEFITEPFQCGVLQNVVENIGKQNREIFSQEKG